MITSTTPPAADPESSLRPRRYGIAIAVAALVVLALIASSILNYVYLDTIPGRASLYGLLTVALITLGTYILVRAYDRDRASRRKHLIRAGVLIGLGVLLWLLVIDVFLFTQSAGPGVAAICALACLPTTAFGLLVVRRMDRNHKEPWRLVLVAAAWGAIVATSLVVWGETIWEASAQRALVPGPGLDTSLAFMAGILEELAKGLAVLLLYLVMRNEFDDVVDGIVYGAAVGLGFNKASAGWPPGSSGTAVRCWGFSLATRPTPPSSEPGLASLASYTAGGRRCWRSWPGSSSPLPDTSRGTRGPLSSRSRTRCSGSSRFICAR
ncbi:MAG: PrsW family intramembrane metalloprotease [Chloroflexi bacterium]|nr:MAG: PrsW family intramembrane metalloprotease [Chloroflexota bacterium]